MGGLRKKPDTARSADHCDQRTHYTHEDNLIREIWDDLRKNGYAEEMIRESILKLKPYREKE